MQPFLVIILVSILVTITNITSIFLSEQLLNPLAKGQPLYQEKNHIGYNLIGENFTKTYFLHSRLSATKYEKINANTSNSTFYDGVQDLVECKEDCLPSRVLESGSGLDPHIELKDALRQSSRIATALNKDEDEINKLITKHAHKKILNLFGNQIVNVQKVNLEISKSFL